MVHDSTLLEGFDGIWFFTILKAMPIFYKFMVMKFGPSLHQSQLFSWQISCY